MAVQAWRASQGREDGGVTGSQSPHPSPSSLLLSPERPDAHQRLPLSSPRGTPPEAGGQCNVCTPFALNQKACSSQNERHHVTPCVFPQTDRSLECLQPALQDSARVYPLPGHQAALSSPAVPIPCCPLFHTQPLGAPTGSHLQCSPAPGTQQVLNKCLGTNKQGPNKSMGGQWMPLGQDTGLGGPG